MRRVLSEIQSMPVAQREEAIMQCYALVLERLTSSQIHKVRAEITATPSSLCTCCGRPVFAHLIDMIDGHLALRELSHPH